MTTSRGRWIAAALAALVAIAAAGLGGAFRNGSSSLSARPAGERPELLLLTSLPIVFPDRFTLEAEQPAVLRSLQGRYRVRPISLANQSTLRGHRLLLMAQPQAQPAEVLVDLDSWVRGGGRVLVLADPALAWPSGRPLGDLLQPPTAFADTGLLGHWGLRLDSPERRGPKTLEVGGREVRTVSPGTLHATGSNCVVEPARLVGRCRIGRGEATVIADSDFIDGSDESNLALLLVELARLER